MQQVTLSYLPGISLMANDNPEELLINRRHNSFRTIIFRMLSEIQLIRINIVPLLIEPKVGTQNVDVSPDWKKI